MISYHPKIIFLSGVSGAGKTTLVQQLQKRNSSRNDLKFLFFDSIGVPTHEEMVDEFGSGKQWQKAMTYQWIKKIQREYSQSKVVVIEGQTELTFIEEAFKHYGVESYKIILIHAVDEARHKRLQFNRNQPELINLEMDNWADYLYKQACDMQVDIIDNSSENAKTAIDTLQQHITKI